MNSQTIKAWKEEPSFRVLMFSAIVMALYILSFQCQAALSAEDTVAELATLTSETKKIVKNGCYIAGSASALVGTIWAVASQNLKIAASSAAITVIALKAGSFFSTTLLI